MNFVTGTWSQVTLMVRCIYGIGSPRNYTQSLKLMMTFASVFYGIHTRPVRLPVLAGMEWLNIGTKYLVLNWIKRGCFLQDFPNISRVASWQIVRRGELFSVSSIYFHEMPISWDHSFRQFPGDFFVYNKISISTWKDVVFMSLTYFSKRVSIS